METAQIERELVVEAPPETVFAVVSSPEHIQQWWPEEADVRPEPGYDGRVGFGADAADRTYVRLTVVDVDPPRRFSFRWTHGEGETAGPGNSFLVVFELEAAGAGTRLRMTETGFDERGWDEATVAAHHTDHARAWDVFLPQLQTHAAKVAADG